MCVFDRAPRQTSRAVDSWDATVIEAFEAYAVGRLLGRRQIDSD